MVESNNQRQINPSLFDPQLGQIEITEDNFSDSIGPTSEFSPAQSPLSEQDYHLGNEVNENFQSVQEQIQCDPCLSQDSRQKSAQRTKLTLQQKLYFYQSSSINESVSKHWDPHPLKLHKGPFFFDQNNLSQDKLILPQMSAPKDDQQVQIPQFSKLASSSCEIQLGFSEDEKMQNQIDLLIKCQEQVKQASVEQLSLESHRQEVNLFQLEDETNNLNVSQPIEQQNNNSSAVPLEQQAKFESFEEAKQDQSPPKSLNLNFHNKDVPAQMYGCLNEELKRRSNEQTSKKSEESDSIKRQWSNTPNVSTSTIKESALSKSFSFINSDQSKCSSSKSLRHKSDSSKEKMIAQVSFCGSNSQNAKNFHFELQEEQQQVQDYVYTGPQSQQFLTLDQLKMDKQVIFSNLQFYGQIIDQQLINRQAKFKKVCPKKLTLIFEPVDTFFQILDPSQNQKLTITNPKVKNLMIKDQTNQHWQNLLIKINRNSLFTRLKKLKLDYEMIMFSFLPEAFLEELKRQMPEFHCIFDHTIGLEDCQLLGDHLIRDISILLDGQRQPDQLVVFDSSNNSCDKECLNVGRINPF